MKKLTRAWSVGLLIAIFSAAFDRSANAQPLPTVVYDSVTGGIWFQDVVDMVGLRLDTSPSLLVPGQAADLGGAAEIVNDQASRGFIEWGNLFSMTFENAFAGNFFVPGTPFSELHGSVFRARSAEAPADDIFFAPEFFPEFPIPGYPVPDDPIPDDPTPDDPVPDDPTPDDPVPDAPIVPVVQYNPATGGITFEDVVDLVGIRVNAPGLLVAGEATDLGGAASGTWGVVNDQADRGYIEWGNLLGMTFDSGFAGNIFAPGTSPFSLGDTEWLARHKDEPGVVINFATRVVPLIPEPSTLLMAGAGLVGLVTCRRRRRA